MGNKQWGHGFYNGIDKQEGAFNAIRAGAADAIWQAMCNITQMPGTDTFETIKEGIKDAVEGWMATHKDEIIEAISKKVTSVNLYDLKSLEKLLDKTRDA